MDSQKIRLFSDLVAWKKGHELVLGIYKATAELPRSEDYALTSQIRRAAVSITSNIAEGFARNSDREKIQFYYLALGSLAEVQSQLIIARDVSYIDDTIFNSLTELSREVHGLLFGMVNHLR